MYAQTLDNKEHNLIAKEAVAKKLSNEYSFTEGPAVDKKGNVYLTGNGVTVFNKQGEKIAHIDIKEPWTSNVCFGGKDFKTLFITAVKAVYTLKMNVKGMK